MSPTPVLHDSWITLLSCRSGDNVLYRMRPDGDELAPLLGGEIGGVPGLRAGQSLYRQPHWSRLSPDRLLYLSWTVDRVLPETNPNAPVPFLIHLGGTEGGPTRLLSAIDRTAEVFCWAPDSERIAYSRFIGPNRGSARGSGLGPGVAATQVVVARIDGTHEDVVLEKAGFWQACDWSPDGRHLLLLYGPSGSPVYGRSDLITFDLFNAQEQRARFEELRPGEDYASGIAIEFGCLKSLTDGGSVGCFYNSARYSPGGREIAVTFSRRVGMPDSRTYELGIWNIASATLRTIVGPSDSLHGPLCWSPDGSQILFTRRPVVSEAADEGANRNPQDLEIWSVCPDGNGEHFVTNGWSPDWR